MVMVVAKLIQIQLKLKLCLLVLRFCLHAFVRIIIHFILPFIDRLGTRQLIDFYISNGVRQE